MADVNFKNLIISDWKQFEKIEIDFHPQLTILTGANGSGKTTILNLLSRHFGWNHIELSTPAIEKSTGFFRFFNRFFKSPSTKKDFRIGELVYSNNQKSDLTIPDNNSTQYSVSINTGAASLFTDEFKGKIESEYKDKGIKVTFKASGGNDRNVNIDVTGTKKDPKKDTSTDDKK